MYNDSMIDNIIKEKLSFMEGSFDHIEYRKREKSNDLFGTFKNHDTLIAVNKYSGRESISIEAKIEKLILTNDKFITDLNIEPFSILLKRFNYINTILKAYIPNYESFLKSLGVFFFYKWEFSKGKCSEFHQIMAYNENFDNDYINDFIGSVLHLRLFENEFEYFAHKKLFKDFIINLTVKTENGITPEFEYLLESEDYDVLENYITLYQAITI